MTVDLDLSPGTRSLWAGKAIPWEHLEEEVALLWKMAADNMRIGQNMSVRTSVLNLVICAPSTARARYVSNLLRDLLSTHIARVVILILEDDRDAPASIATWVTLRSFPVISDLTRHHFEQITALLSGPVVEHSAALLQKLVRPDLPIYLWWLDEPPAGGDPLDSLAAISQRLIVDSASFQTPGPTLRLLASLLETHPSCAISDLNWGRLTPLRQLVAQFFDGLEYRPYFEGIQRIEIEHAVLEAPGGSDRRLQGAAATLHQRLQEPARALLMGGWLKERLTWRRVACSASCPGSVESLPPGAYHWCLENGAGQPTRIDIRPRAEGEVPPGTICLLRLTSRLEDQQALFSISRLPGDSDHVLTSIELEQEQPRQRTLNLNEQRQESQLLVDELEITGHDDQFERILQELAALLA
ncbi:glucose-6-phosphate dehydrogenase assembly protein OpcA [Thermogemmatispora sp.]|uniref:glucose-6-phosphate dehydrogenase assembly protein OpcA n=1 Tax=Thermogemmatispora sp. TaxID=1968838 RepID=UPI001D786B43|nr:glucose-6-phosphate dehydrogenase assembly protein OpcA [Thermogemmatispora sp.]MBX5450056.1 glucose-6-phosphate dehydrogenase assembly protein OpcA [Thermogemmatispora sp.]